MSASTPKTAVHYDPYDVDIDDDPYPTWRRLRDQSPLYRNDDLDFCQGVRGLGYLPVRPEQRSTNG